MSVWYPYTQMKKLGDLPVVVKAEGSSLHFENGKIVLDAISSWWACIHGYNFKPLNKVLKKQIDSFSHVMLGGLTHQPAMNLANKLVQITPKGLNHVFFADSGSVAIEVTMKMAIQYWSNQNQNKKVKFISLKNGYHGDTFKAMEISDDSDLNQAFKHILTKDFVVEIPQKSVEDFSEKINAFNVLLENHHHEIAAIVLEPILQCAGGFHIYEPSFLNKVNLLCKKYNILTIYDEVATGFGRTGKLFATDYLDHAPDMLVLGKALTGGYLGHAAVITKTKVFNQFLSDKHEFAFMHGPTFMANPLSCTVALKSIEVFEKENYLKKIKSINKLMHQNLTSIKSNKVKAIRIIGAVACIEFISKKELKGFNDFALKHNVFIRPIDKYLYIMPSYRMKKKELRSIISVIEKWIFKIK